MAEYLRTRAAPAARTPAEVRNARRRQKGWKKRAGRGRGAKLANAMRKLIAMRGPMAARLYKLDHDRPPT